MNEYLDGIATEIRQHAVPVSSGQLFDCLLLKNRFENQQKVFTGIKEAFAQYSVKVL